MDYEILVVDTQSAMDDTSDICAQYEVRYVARENGNHYGDAIRTGFSKSKGKYVVVMDADGSHDAAKICEFYREMKNSEFGLIIGSRYCKGGYTD